MRVSLSTPVQGVDALAFALGARTVILGRAPATLRGIATDSREVLPGDLFALLQGERLHGADFVGDAVSRGAVALLAEREPEVLPENGILYLVQDVRAALLRAAAHRRRLTNARVIAVGGSAGKTTVKELLAALLATTFRVRHSEGNFNSDLGMPLSLLSFEEADCFLLELGINHPGEMKRLSLALSPDVAILTSVGRAHIGHFADAEALRLEKLSIAAGLSSDGTLILPEGIVLSEPHPPYRVLRTGVGMGADVRAGRVHYFEGGTVASVYAEDRWFSELSWPIPGAMGLSAILFAAATARLFHLPEALVREGLFAAAKATPRMRRIQLGERLVVDDTYNASPEAVFASLEALRYLGGARPRVAVLGDMGELGAFSRGAHREIGAYAARSGVCLLAACGSEAETVAEGAVSAGLGREQIGIFAAGELGELAPWLERLAPRHAAVLFKASRKTGLDVPLREWEARYHE